MQDPNLFIDRARVEIRARNTTRGIRFKDATWVAETIAAMYVTFFHTPLIHFWPPNPGFTTSTCLHPAGRLCTIFYVKFYAKVLPIARFEHDWLPTGCCARDISYCMISSTHWPHCITQDYLCLLRLRVSQSSSLQSLDLLRHPLHLHCISISSFCKVLHAQSQLWERRTGICFQLVSAQNIAKIVPRLDRSWTLPS